MFGIDDAVVAVSNVVGKIIDHVAPDQTVAAQLNAKIEEMKLGGALKEIIMADELLKGQLNINAVEAANPSIFIAGWRPAVGWLCGIAFGYAVIVTPFMEFVARMTGYTGAFPVIDTAMTMQILMGMLGMAGLRSYDKIKETDNGH